MDVNTPSPFSIPHPIKSAAIARGSHDAVVDDSGTWSYATLLEQIELRANQLRIQGVKAGDLVALKGEYDRRWVRDMHAIGWLGAAVAPLDPASTTAQEEKRLSALQVDHHLHSNESIENETPWTEERFWPPEETRVVTTTSGTTGTPKVVALNTGQWMLSAFASATRLGLNPADRWLACLPLHHVGGLSILFRSAFYGTTCVVHPNFDANRVSACIDEGSINMVSLVPTMLSAILDARDDKPFPDTMRVVLLGGGAASSTLLERARKLQLPLSTTWGMTESASQVATAFPGEISADGFVGPPLPFARVTQQDQTLHIQGPLVGGSLQTSDRGAISDNGLIQIDGRDDDVIISGGKKFNPREIEEALTRHPAIAEAGVVGVPDEKWGERIAAVLVSPPGLEALSSDEVLLWCREHLGAHHTPKEVHWRSGLPRNDMGKIVRDRLRKEICP